MIKEAAFACGPFLGRPRKDYIPNGILWTPDSSHLVFNQGGAVWKVDVQGTQLQQVLDANAKYLTSFSFADFLEGFHMSLSPDGMQLAYTSCQFPTEHEDSARTQAILAQDGPEWYERSLHQYEIAISEIDGDSQQRITRNRADDHYPVWSPSGDRIAFAMEGILHTMLPDGSDVQPAVLAPMHMANTPPVWSSDGQRLAFVVREEEYPRQQQSVYTVRSDGSELFKVGEMGNASFFDLDPAAAPTWSPNGERLAFSGFNGEEAAIHAVRFDGSDLRQVWSGTTDAYPRPISQISWSPDGSELLFQYDGVYLIRLDGCCLRQLYQTGMRYTVVAWSPDGSRIAIYSSDTWSSSWERSEALLHIVNRDGTDLRVLVHTDDDGEPVAANPEDEEPP